MGRRYGGSKGGRGGGDRRGPRGTDSERRVGRKSPPPESTGEEGRYLFALRDRQTPVTVSLVDGDTFRGTIEYYDRDTIKIVPPSGPGRFIRKTDIRHLTEEADSD